MFDGYLTPKATCERCGFPIADHDSGDGPAVFIILILGAVVVPLAFWVETSFGPPLWVHAILWSIVTLGGSLALLRPFKGVLIALQARHRTPGQ